MASSAMLKAIVKRRSTQASLRNAQRAIRSLCDDLIKEIRYGRDLRRHCRGKTELLLNVGCGELVQSGWINIDFQSRPGVFYFNVLNPLPMPDGTVSHIHTEHFLEHLEYSDAIRFLTECHRVLKSGGTMRIIVPDAEKYMRAYARDDKVFFERLKDLGGASEPLPTKDAICNQMFHMGGAHLFAWDFETLEHAARQIGFLSVKNSMQNDSSSRHCIDGQDWWRSVESLYVDLSR